MGVEITGAGAGLAVQRYGRFLSALLNLELMHLIISAAIEMTTTSGAESALAIGEIVTPTGRGIGTRPATGDGHEIGT